MEVIETQKSLKSFKRSAFNALLFIIRYISNEAMVGYSY